MRLVYVKVRFSISLFFLVLEIVILLGYLRAMKREVVETHNRQSKNYNSKLTMI